MVLDCGMMGAGGGMGDCMNHSSIALLLIALGIGAIVHYKAIKATCCQMLGKVLSYVIMIIAMMGLICSIHCAYKAHKCHDDKKACHEAGEGKEKGKSMEGMQLPPGHPDISTMKAPAAPATK